LRDLIEAGSEIQLMGYQENEDPDDLLDLAEKKIFSITQKNLTQSFLPIKPYLEEAFERIDRMSKQKGATRVLLLVLRGLILFYQGYKNQT
jgi:replicative DNA helicase